MLDHCARRSDLAASRAFYEAALAPLGYGVVMEREGTRRLRPARRGRSSGSTRASRAPTSTSPSRRPTASDVDAFHAAALAAGAARQRRPGHAPAVPPALLRRVRPRPRRQQRRGRLPHARMITRGFHRRRERGRRGSRPASTSSTASPCSRPGPRRTRRSSEWDFAITGAVDSERTLDLGRAPGAAARGDHRRHPLRDDLDQARHELDRRLRRHAARRRRAARRLRHRALRRRLHDEPARRGRHRRQGLDRLRLRRRRRSSPSTAAPRACSSRTCTSGRARSGCGG